MKELIWFEDALANGYQNQLWYSKIIVLQFHDEMETYNPLMHIHYRMRNIKMKP